MCLESMVRLVLITCFPAEAWDLERALDLLDTFQAHLPHDDAIQASLATRKACLRFCKAVMANREACQEFK